MMKTIWGETLDVNNVLQEYPRPQMVRNSFINLNGIWEYAITDNDDTSNDNGMPPSQFDGEIIVPFSPECELSGVLRVLSSKQTLWYKRSFSLTPDTGRTLLHFGAVDQTATVYVNGNVVCSHTGGYTSFSVDITDYVIHPVNTDDAINEAEYTNTLLVNVRDLSDTSYHSRGKQKTRRGGIWYTSQSGIWQTVWMEHVPEEYVAGLHITPLFDEAAVQLIVISDVNHPCTASIADISAGFISNEPVKIPLPGFIPWSPEHPHLYDIDISMETDSVRSCFGMRKFGVETDDCGIRRLFLNGKPYFHNGVLDQGYYSDGMYTAPSDEAMIFDIQLMKDMGFSMIRKHIKIEPMRWYYHCDRLGMLVWQDMLNGGGDYGAFTISSPLVTGIHFKDSNYRRFGREDTAGREQYYQELDEMIKQLYNVTSICMWVPFNEGWGQFDSDKAVQRILALDTTRTIDHASGWHDQGIGEIHSLHVYFKKYRFRPDKHGRAVVLSEFGGYNYRVHGHSFNKKDFGYKRFETPEKLMQAYSNLYENEIIPARERGLCAAVYTQLSDVEDELNGLVTYDRKVVKLPADKLKEINEKLK